MNKRDRNYFRVSNNSFLHIIFLRCFKLIERQTFWKGHICIKKLCKSLETTIFPQTLITKWTLGFWQKLNFLGSGRIAFETNRFLQLVYILICLSRCCFFFFVQPCHSNKVYKFWIISGFWIHYWKFDTKIYLSTCAKN